MLSSKHLRPWATTPALARLAATGLLALAAGFSASASAQSGPGPGMGGPGMHGPGGTGPWMGDPAQMGRHIDRMLDGLNVSEAQRTQIRQIAQAAATDLRAQHETGHALREKGLQILTAPTVDAAAAEAVRQQMLVQHDQTSKRMLQAMLDMAKVLTPEQRAKFGERMKQRSDMMREHGQRMQRASEPAR